MYVELTNLAFIKAGASAPKHSYLLIQDPTLPERINFVDHGIREFERVSSSIKLCSFDRAEERDFNFKG